MNASDIPLAKFMQLGSSVLRLTFALVGPLFIAERRCRSDGLLVEGGRSFLTISTVGDVRASVDYSPLML